MLTKVFISYAWESEEHREWVKALANRLLSDGIDAVLDQYDLELGDRLPQFMEQSVRSSDYVLIVCTPAYKQKADARIGGVGYEGHIISGELFSGHNERKFIPVIKEGALRKASRPSSRGNWRSTWAMGSSLVAITICLRPFMGSRRSRRLCPSAASLRRLRKNAKKRARALSPSESSVLWSMRWENRGTTERGEVPCTKCRSDCRDAPALCGASSS